jgi:2'-5' RNA ligase
MTEIQPVSPPGYFALVSYVPDPLGTYLDSMQATISGTEGPQAHVTMLPTRPLGTLTFEKIYDGALGALESVQPFRVVLSRVKRFLHTNVLYVDLAEGSEMIHLLHNRLNLGALAFPEQFDFRPHVTLAGSLSDEQIDSAQHQAEELWEAYQFPPEFFVNEVVCISTESAGEDGTWRRIWSHDLGGDPVARAATIQI